MIVVLGPDHRRRNTGTGDTSSSVPVQGVIDFPIVSSFYQHCFESPKSVKVLHDFNRTGVGRTVSEPPKQTA